MNFFSRNLVMFHDSTDAVSGRSRRIRTDDPVEPSMGVPRRSGTEVARYLTERDRPAASHQPIDPSEWSWDDPSTEAAAPDLVDKERRRIGREGEEERKITVPFRAILESICVHFPEARRMGGGLPRAKPVWSHR